MSIEFIGFHTMSDHGVTDLKNGQLIEPGLADEPFAGQLHFVAVADDELAAGHLV